MSDRLILALPSKGRLHDGARAFFESAGLRLARDGGARAYQGVIANIPDTEILYLSAGEIAAGLHGGTIHLGVTGEDLIQESESGGGDRVHRLAALGFGRADVVVAVPRAWIDVNGIADLADVAQDFRIRHHGPLRVATKYAALTRRFFAAHGLADYRIVDSQGATEGAPAAGTAELIVDITSTGATLAANQLKVVAGGVILKSEAQLAASLAAPWGEAARAALARITDLTGARAQGRAMLELHALPGPRDKNLIAALCAEHHCIAPYADSHGITLYCPEQALQTVVARLRAGGCSHVAVSRPDYLFGPGNPLCEAFLARLDG